MWTKLKNHSKWSDSLFEGRSVNTEKSMIRIISVTWLIFTYKVKRTTSKIWKEWMVSLHRIFFLIMCATLAQLHVMVRRLPNGFVHAYFWGLVHKIFHLFMCKCIYTLGAWRHAQTPKDWHTKLSGSLPSNTTVPIWQCGTSFRKKTPIVLLN